MDKIIIEDLTLDVHVGVPEAERLKKQRLLMTLEIEHPLQAAALEDSIALTIDYARVTEAVCALAMSVTSTPLSWQASTSFTIK